MSDLELKLERALAAGRITELDAEEIRRFRAYLEALGAAGITPALRNADPEAAAKARAIYLEHYPEHQTDRLSIQRKED